MPQSLQYVQPLFTEVRTTRAWGKPVMRTLAVMLSFFALVEIAIAILAWQKLNLGFRGLHAGICVLFVALPVVLMQMRAVIVLEPTALQLRLAIGSFNFWKRTIRLATVKSVEKAPPSRARSVLRFAPRLTQFMTGASNVLLKVEGGTIEIGSAQPEALLESLQSALENRRRKLRRR